MERGRHLLALVASFVPAPGNIVKQREGKECVCVCVRVRVRA